MLTIQVQPGEEAVFVSPERFMVLHVAAGPLQCRADVRILFEEHGWALRLSARPGMKTILHELPEPVMVGKEKRVLVMTIPGLPNVIAVRLIVVAWP